MKSTVNLFRNLLFLICCLTNTLTFAVDSASTEKHADTAIKSLYHTLNSLPTTSMPDRINWISAQFKGQTYSLGALGEGPNARYDQFPRYRVDQFDCDTYVNTVLSLALANSPNNFHQCLKKIRYKNGMVSYINRNHFTSVDWNVNNQHYGILKDVTLEIKDKEGHSVAQYALTEINKPGWYAYKTLDVIRLQNQNKLEQEKRLEELKIKGKKLAIQQSKLPYIPFTALYSADGKANKYLFSQIPNGAVIEIVRPNWDLRNKIGTALDISHLGFAIWINNQLYFRQASSQYGKIVDTPMIEYLSKAKENPTIKGIHIEVVISKAQPTIGICR